MKKQRSGFPSCISALRSKLAEAHAYFGAQKVDARSKKREAANQKTEAL
jgi:hypothetical protein